MRVFAVILATVATIYVASAQPADLPPKEEVAAILDELASVVLSLKFQDIPEALAKRPPSEMSSCISPGQRALTKTCVSTVDKTKSIKEGVPAVTDCILKSIEAWDEAADKIDSKKLKEGMIEATLLSAEQKAEAMKTVDECLATTFNLPPDAVQRKRAVPAKAMICSIKAIAINGCADVKQPTAPASA